MAANPTDAQDGPGPTGSGPVRRPPVQDRGRRRVEQILDAAAGLNPLRLSAVRTQGPLRADLVLTPADSQALKDALLNKKVADEAAIIVVL